MEDQIVAHVPITISIDVDQLLKSELGWTAFNAGSYEDPELEYTQGGNGHLIDVVASKLADTIKADIIDSVRQAVRDKALEKVDAIIDEVLTGSITLTSKYGEPKSPEMSMREAMIKAMTDRLTEQVDHDGKRTQNGYGRSGKTYLQWHVEQAARAVLDKELSAKVANAAKQIKSATTDLVGKRIAEVLGRGF